MASGLPVICTPTLGNAPFVDHGVNGFRLRSTGDRERAAWLLEALERDPGLRQRIGAAARHTACQMTWTRMGRAYESLYLELLSELAPARFPELSIGGQAGLSSAGRHV
jgi:glycosyltransferase involved in cell wall biosynthesis